MWNIVFTHIVRRLMSPGTQIREKIRNSSLPTSHNASDDKLIDKTEWSRKIT